MFDTGYFILYCGNALNSLPRLNAEAAVDMVFADPPCFLRLKEPLATPNNGLRQQGQLLSTRISTGYARFNRLSLELWRDALKPNSRVWVSGTHHVIHSVGFAMPELGLKLLKDTI